MIIQCDFDGTIIKNNLSVLIREKYACSDWQKIDLDYLHGPIIVEQSNKLQFALIKEPKERLQAFVRQHIELRSDFVKFIRYCQESAIPFAIVSSRLDFYKERHTFWYCRRCMPPSSSLQPLTCSADLKNIARPEADKLSGG